MQLAQDGSRFVVFANELDRSAQINSRPLRLTQLDPNAIFAMHLLNHGKVHLLSRGNTLLKSLELQV